MSLRNLLELVEPPAQPRPAGSQDEWDVAERALGVTLPRDYRDYIFTYGTGLFANFYGVYNPFASNRYVSLVDSVERVCGYNRESQRQFPERFPYPYYPEPGGLMPWGRDENGNDYFWLTVGDPKKWKVAQDENRGSGISIHDCTFAEFLVAVLTEQVAPLASDYPLQDDFVFVQ